MGTPSYFFSYLLKGRQLFFVFLFASMDDKTSKKGITLIEKNLLLCEPILSLKIRRPLRREAKIQKKKKKEKKKSELLPLKVYTFTL